MKLAALVFSGGLHFWWLNFPRLHPGAKCMPALRHRRVVGAGSQEEGGEWVEQLVVFVTAGYWLGFGLSDAGWTHGLASAVGCGKKFPFISDNFIGLYWITDFCLDLWLFCISIILCVYIYTLFAQIFWNNRSVTGSTFCNYIISHSHPLFGSGVFFVCWFLAFFSVLCLKMLSLSRFINRSSWFHVSKHMDIF